MKLHVISTINGLENEGMRNVATHLSREFQKKHTVTHSSLKDVFSIIKNGKKSDVTIVFARLIKPVYFILRLIRPFVKRICVVCVQPVSEDFAKLNKKHKVVDHCFCICKDDVLASFEDDIVTTFDVGINAEKFSPYCGDVSKLKETLGLPKDKPIVLHVGHCSSGRFLNEMLTLDKEKYHPVIVASGMFDDENTIQQLKNGGVDLRFGFVKNIEDYYRCADVYFFPTKSSEYVISVPLSCMEALSCGTPVVCYNSFSKMSLIKVNSENAFEKINDVKNLSVAIDKALGNKTDTSYLENPNTWNDVSDEFIRVLEKLG